MVIKVDKSEEFIKSGKKLISEYDAQPVSYTHLTLPTIYSV